MILSKDHPLARVDRLTLRYQPSRFVAIPLYAGDCYVKDLPAVRMTANILVNKMEQLRLPEDLYK